MRRSRLSVVVLLVTAAAAAVVAMTAVGGAQARAQNSCVPQALTPTVSGGRGYARGMTSGCAGISYSFMIDFATTTGQVLATNSGSANQNLGFTAPASGTAQCIGYHVYSYVQIVTGGVTKTAQSSSVSC